jgi:hypothetical protein
MDQLSGGGPDEREGLSTGGSQTYSIDVIDPGIPIVASLVYHDFPYFGAGLVNHLDLKIVTPSGIVVFPNGLEGPDSLNNVEQVVIPASRVVAGRYDIVVEGTDVPWGGGESGGQPYALVWSAGTFIPVGRCAARPWLCADPRDMGLETVQIECALIDCIVLDPLPRNCLVKFPCPGCGPGGLCPPYYHIALQGMGEAWRVGLFDAEGMPVPHDLIETPKGPVISFRPSKEAFINGQIGNYMLAFQLTRKGRPGRPYDIKVQLDVADHPYGRPAKAAKR